VSASSPAPLEPRSAADVAVADAVQPEHPGREIGARAAGGGSGGKGVVHMPGLRFSGSFGTPPGTPEEASGGRGGLR